MSSQMNKTKFALILSGPSSERLKLRFINLLLGKETAQDLFLLNN